MGPTTNDRTNERTLFGEGTVDAFDELFVREDGVGKDGGFRRNTLEGLERGHAHFTHFLHLTKQTNKE